MSGYLADPPRKRSNQTETYVRVSSTLVKGEQFDTARRRNAQLGEGCDR
jgi:hypothetical protein